VSIRGQQQHEIAIPINATPGQRLWFEREGRWIDFTVVALTDTDIWLEGSALQVRLRSNASGVEEFTVNAAGQSRRVTLPPNLSATVTFDLGNPNDEDARVIEISIHAVGLTQRFERGLRIVREIAPLGALPAKWLKGMALRGKPETSDFGATGSFVDARETSSGQVAKRGIFMHPPWQGGSGYCFARYDAIALPAAPPAAFRAVVGKGDGSDPGDGILYKLVVLDDTGVATVAAEKLVTRHEWFPIEADLSRWAGRRIALKLFADVGPKDDSGGDWACWADMRLETLRPELHYLLDERSDLVRREPGPHRVENLTIEMLRSAKSGWLRYDGRGLEGPGTHTTYGVLNGIALGEMKGAHAEEKKGAFQQSVGVPLTAEAIRSLGRRNRFALQNPNKDYFTVRRFWLELELADGRRCSSDIAPQAFTQPPEWPPGEGIGVPFGRDITVDLWFPVTEMRASVGEAMDPTQAEETLKQALKLRQTGSNSFVIGAVKLDRAEATVTFPAKANMREFVVEYALVTAYGKTHESVFTTEARPQDIHLACLLLGAQPSPIVGETNSAARVPTNSAAIVEIVWSSGGKVTRLPLSKLILLAKNAGEKTSESLRDTLWLYNGSQVDVGGFIAQQEGSILSLIRDPNALLNNPATDRDNDDVHFPNTKLLPSAETPVEVVLRFPALHP
jgi:hypothetical protein